MEAIHSDLIRKAFGRFATGVTIVTTVDSDGGTLGMTASSFNSVSLDPPMVLWSAGRQASEYDVFAECKKYAVHVLSDAQAEMSNRFATPNIDKFEGVNWHMTENGLPMLADCPLCLECETVARHPASDHMILIGQVINVHLNEAHSPLLYYSSAYHSLGGPLG